MASGASLCMCLCRKISMKLRICIIIILVSIVFCSRRFMLKSHFKGPVFVFEEIDLADTPTKKDYPDANAVYILREGKFNVQTMLVDLRYFSIDVPWSTFSEHVVLKVLDDGGKRYADIRIPFWQDWELLDFKARTIKPSGEVVELNREDIYEVSYFPKFILYADMKAKVFAFPAVDTGCILEYIYTLGYKEPYVPRWFFHAQEPTVKAAFSYDIPKKVQFVYTHHSQPGVEIVRNVMSTSSRHKVAFEGLNLPAVRYEPLAPPITDVSSWLLMAFAAIYQFGGRLSSGQETWYEIGKNYSLLMDSLLTATESIETKAKEITAACTTDEDRIRTIFEYIQEHCRYVAVEVEGHRIFPHPPEEVLLNQYGDCKDLSGLLISMLRTVGINACPVLIGTRRVGPFIEDFPSLSQFNHVIVGLPVEYFNDTTLIKNAIAHSAVDFMHTDDCVILDPTAETVPIGQLHKGINGRKAVVCAGFDSRLITLPVANFRTNEWRTCLVFKFDKNDYSGKINLRVTGEDASLLRYLFLNSSSLEVENYILEYLSEFPLKLSLDTFELRNVTDLDSTLVVNISFSKFSPMQIVKEQILVPTMLRSLSQFKDIYLCKTRKYDIEFGYPQLHYDIVKIVLPEDCRLKSLPEKETAKNPWCEYSFSSYVSGDTVIVNRNIAIKKSLVPKKCFAEIKEFSTKVLDSSHRLLIFAER